MFLVRVRQKEFLLRIILLIIIMIFIRISSVVTSVFGNSTEYITLQFTIFSDSGQP